MWKTVLILLLTIILIPLLAFLVDEPLTIIQKTVLTELILVYLFAAVICFIVSTISDNFSQVDKLWSILPVVYLWIIAFRSGFEPRVLLMAILVTIWGIRLTFNFGRRGGYSWKFWSGEEDYRWSVLRKRSEFSGRWRWIAFNLFFISLYQLGLVLMITLPALKSIGGKELWLPDYLLAGLFLAFVVTETIADQQQWNFHKEKNRLLRSNVPLPDKYNSGFLKSGLWGMVRHPNYASEQAIWVVFYFFSVFATGFVLNWSITGSFLLILLFRGSSDFSESISMVKYPGYSEYIKSVPRHVPDFFRRKSS